VTSVAFSFGTWADFEALLFCGPYICKDFLPLSLPYLMAESFSSSCYFSKSYSSS